MSTRAMPSSIKSAERAFAIIEFFNVHRRPATVSHLCEALEIPQSSMSMLLKCLIELGYIQRIEGTRTYVPSGRTAFLSDWTLERIGQKSMLCQIADDVARDFGETAVVGTQNGPYVQYLYVASARDKSQIRTRVGMKIPMACTAAGRSLLSRLEDGTILRIARRNNSEALPQNRVPERKLIEMIGVERAQGFFESRGGLVEGINNISILLSQRARETPLMIGVGGPAEHMMQIRDDIVSRLKTIPEHFRYEGLST